MNSDCPHVMHDDDLRRFYREHPELLCARCQLAGRIVLERASGQRLAFLRTED